MNAPGHLPGRGWRVVRRFTQAALLLTLCAAPFLGGWQRLDRNNLANWDGHGWDLPPVLLDLLPLGDAPATVYEANQMLGGGAAAALAGVPALDPIAGLFATLGGAFTWKLLLAWSLPLLLSLLAGRVFCGWFCPFGVLARFGDGLFERLPWRPKPIRLPRRRPVRWLVLAAVVLAGFFGFQLALYLVLPHVLVQMSAYSFWLLGGGGAVFGWLIGLLLAGLVFGPTTYCATVCPTGAALSLGGHLRRARVFIAAPSECGARCNLCTRACWLQLDPASGDPGPDCDLCARCFDACPRTNLRVGLVATAARAGQRLTEGLPLALALFAGLAALAPAPAQAEAATQPRLLLDARVTRGDVQAAFSVVDVNGVRLDADDPTPQRGVDISLFVARGDLSDPGDDGRIASRRWYEGPVTFRLVAADGELLHRGAFEKPNEPRSTPRRRIYRARIDVPLAPGDAIEIEPIEGWLTAQVRVVLPTKGAGAGLARLLWAALAGTLVFGGLFAIALALPDRAPAG
ncbi:MAG: 4Fe-4S binding protein [Myxococcales bacterium]|nr:4Fe-4S binding protein [Myxococcales bacterium]